MKEFCSNVIKTIKKHKVITIIISVVIVLVVTFSCLGAFVFNRFSQGKVPTEKDLAYLRENGYVYDHVVIFGVDGAGGYFDKMYTPGFDSIFKNDTIDASITYKGISQFPTISAQNWGSMIHGVRSNKHGLTNSNTARETGQKYTDTKYPSFFKVYAERHPDVYMASIVHWDPINYGIIEDMPQIRKITAEGEGEDSLTDGKAVGMTSEDLDTLVCGEVIRQIKEENPKILFAHFDCVDSAGHSYGWGKEPYVHAVKHVDGLMGEIYKACQEAGWEKNTLFICISDHGHETWGGHGSNNYNVRHITFAVAGGKGNVIKGKPGHVVTQDMAAVVLYALGEKQPDSWDARVPNNMFKNL